MERWFSNRNGICQCSEPQLRQSMLLNLLGRGQGGSYTLHSMRALDKSGCVPLLGAKFYKWKRLSRKQADFTQC